jgi:YggT family protein
MFVFANLLTALAAVIGTLLTVYTWILIARAVISWVNPDPYNPIVRFLYNVTEPVLYRVRRLVPSVFGGIDLSPLILILALQFLQIFLVGSLRDLAVTLR